MKAFLVLLFLTLCNISYATNYDELARSIEPQAITIGEGDHRVYAFLDPMCSKSQHFLDLIVHSEKLQEINTYYIFLYRLPKFESDALISYIYDAYDILDTMKTVMIEGYEPKLTDYQASPRALERKFRIQEIADKFQAKRRPYLLIFKQGSHYCKISEGTAPCMKRSRP